MGFIVFIVIVAVIVGLVVTIYNGLVTSRNIFKNAFAQIDVQLKRRYDLIPNIVETAKKYMSHEQETLERVIQARNAAQSIESIVSKNPGDMEQMKSLLSAESGLTASLGRIFALSESYPDLKANTTMMELMEELRSTENKISFARQAYNDSIMSYNNKREVFPNNIISGMFHFQPGILWEVSQPEEREAVKVKF